MARDKKEIRELKIKALNEAVETLKEESTPISNQVTFAKVTALANESYADKLPTKIEEGSIKRPSSKEFEDIKTVIDNFREECRNIKVAVPKKAVKETTKLKSQIDLLVSHIAQFYDEKLLFTEKLEAKERTIEKLKKEIKKQQNEIQRLKGQV
ncbi:MAG: hypothetical protein U9N33_10440 [Campylobacterota bacterium]|nr:hypothetical protein [Campylobacterota bacterium]